MSNNLKDILIAFTFVNTVFLLDLMFIKHVFMQKTDKPVVNNDNTVQEEYEEIVEDEFDNRIHEIKMEIEEKKSKGEFEVNQAEVITDEYEKKLYSSVD